MISRNQTSSTEQDDENFYANAFGPGHPQYLNELRRLKPENSRLSTRLAARKQSAKSITKVATKPFVKSNAKPIVKPESETSSELPLEQRYLTFVRPKKKNKQKEDSSQTSEFNQNGTSVRLLEDYDVPETNGRVYTPQTSTPDDSQPEITDAAESSINDDNGISNEEEDVHDNSRFNGVTENYRQEEDEEIEDEDRDEVDEEEDDDEECPDDEDDDDYEDDEVGVYDLNGGNAVTTSIQRNHRRQADITNHLRQPSTSSLLEASDTSSNARQSVSDNQNDNSNNNYISNVMQDRIDGRPKNHVVSRKKYSNKSDYML